MAITTEDFRWAYTEFTRRPAPEVGEGDTLAGHRLDSLGMLEIIGLIEEKHGISVDEDDLVDLKTVGDLLRVLNATLARKAAG